MGAAEKAFVAALVASAFMLAPARAQEPIRPGYAGPDAGYACFGPRERLALVESGAVLRLVSVLYSVRTRVPGTLVHARLCRRPEGFVYVLTVLAVDGRVTHVIVDAVKGSFVGVR